MSDVTSDASGEAARADRRAELLVRLFDLRSFIGSLFIVFGVIVTISGATASQADIDKAAGIHISLWTGLVMLVVGAGFIGWLLLAPPEVVRREEGDEDPMVGKD